MKTLKHSVVLLLAEAFRNGGAIGVQKGDAGEEGGRGGWAAAVGRRRTLQKHEDEQNVANCHWFPPLITSKERGHSN